MFDLTAMPWLEPAPEAFRQLCASFALDAPDAGPRLVRLAAYRTDSARSRAFAKLVGRAKVHAASLAPLSPARVAVLGSGTLDMLVDALPIACVRHGVAATIVAGEYDRIVQTALDPDAAIFTPAPDYILVQFDHRWLGIHGFAAVTDEAADLASSLERVGLALRGLRQASGARILVTNLATPPGGIFGSLDSAVPGTQRRRIAAFNAGLAVLAREQGALLIDIAGLAEQVGTARWFDPVLWNLYRIPFAADCVGIVADTIARVIGASRGRARKCLVLDCDDTLWGGVIGDDGIDAIRIGNGDPEGEAFLAVQQLALDLKRRGVILAVCSRNYDPVAIEPFRSHAGMLLRESDIAVFQANWQDKASNLQAIARTLNIGVDALVFLDDNAAERAQVRSALPLVAVPELPADPAWYPVYLASAGYFEAIAFSGEDADRAASYAANAQRAEVLAHARDLGSYLDALQMRFSHWPFDDAGTARIAQLINKSNQFNLTTRRYSEADVRAFAADPATITMQVRLRDKFSDFGVIGVVIARPVDAFTLAIDSWLMSCRVLGRRVEHAMVNALVAQARERGYTGIEAHYIPTPKNGMVSELYDGLGFTLQKTVDGVKRYRLELAAFDPFELPFELS